MSHTHDYRQQPHVLCRHCGLTENEVRLTAALERILAVSTIYMKALDDAGKQIKEAFEMYDAGRAVHDALDRVREAVAINTKEATK